MSNFSMNAYVVASRVTHNKKWAEKIRTMKRWDGHEQCRKYVVAAAQNGEWRVVLSKDEIVSATVIAYCDIMGCY